MANGNELARTLSTSETARYLTERGVRISKRSLESFRGRPTSAPGELGPEFARDESGRCWYAVADLDRWIAARLNARTRRGDLSQPAQLAKAREKRASRAAAGAAPRPGLDAAPDRAA